jgi:SH3-like domain-containing protein
MKLVVNIIVAILLCSPRIASAVCVQGDCTNGHGTAVLPDESKYVGQFKDGLRSGQGEATYSDGTMYKGEWADDLPNGQGVKILADGMQYFGEFKNGLMYGSGTMIMPDGGKTKIKWLTDFPLQKEVNLPDKAVSSDEDEKDRGMDANLGKVQKPLSLEPQSSAGHMEVSSQELIVATEEIPPQELKLSAETPEQVSPQASAKDEVAVQEQIQTEVVEYSSIAVGANIRSDASLTSEVLRTVPPGYPVVVLSKQVDWFLVEDFRERKGWVSASLITEPRTVIIKVFKGNLRSGPSLKDDIIDQLGHGTVMSVLERSGEWLKVSSSEKLTGWLHRKVIWP